MNILQLKQEFNKLFDLELRDAHRQDVKDYYGTTLDLLNQVDSYRPDIALRKPWYIALLVYLELKEVKYKILLGPYYVPRIVFPDITGYYYPFTYKE